MKDRKAVKFGLSIGGAILFGIFIDECSRFLGAGNRPTSGGVSSVVVPVRLNGIAESDKWITGYNVFFSPGEGIRSDSTYGLLVFVANRPSELSSPPSLGLEQFYLVGLGPHISPFYVNRSAMSASVNPTVVLLDFLQSPKNWSNVDVPSLKLEVKSSPNPLPPIHPLDAVEETKDSGR